MLKKAFTYLASSFSGSSILDLRASGNNPLELLNKKCSSVLVDLDPRYGLSSPAFRLFGGGRHPFVSALAKVHAGEFATSGEPSQLLQVELENFYSRFKPESAAEILYPGFDFRNVALKDAPAYAYVLPWQSASLLEQKSAIERYVVEENRTCASKIGVNEGWAWCGPVSSEKLKVEVARLLTVFNSIREKGYLRNDGKDGDISALVYYHSDSSPLVWQCTVGQHRCFSLSALELKAIPCRVSNIIRREDYTNWPNVRSGLFSEYEALALFDRIYTLGVK